MDYNPQSIEKKWNRVWRDSKAFRTDIDLTKPKYYVLDMFPYPSGTGLHVGHPLGYIASDIFARYKRAQGFNVLHPMGFDAFGLPAEQYAIETGQHPATTTAANIAKFRSQLDNIGFCYDWDREIRTSDPSYYKWTQWIFLQIYNSWYDHDLGKARPISELLEIFENSGTQHLSEQNRRGYFFHPRTWSENLAEEQEKCLMDFRLSYLAEAEVNWCEALGTVLANDEVINGLSERGGHPVIKKRMRQWFLRITDYADRLLEGLQQLDWSDAMKEMQRNWIGKSVGAEIKFPIADLEDSINVFTTRPDTIFGASFMVLAPEHELLAKITTPEQKTEVEKYQEFVQTRSERERLAEVKSITGCFTGAYALNPLNGARIPIWISEYVLAGYGTGAIMAVPAGDQRDFLFARKFNLPIPAIFGGVDASVEAYAAKSGQMINSDFLNGVEIPQAIEMAVDKLVSIEAGKKKIQFRMRDAGFSRQRYWGEPFPIVYREGTPYPLGESELPLELPAVDSYSPSGDGEGPLATLDAWMNEIPGAKRESSTMPGYAGSSWYFLRYADPNNSETFASKQATDYWNQVDLYIGGSEHAVGHLLYARLWTKILFDLGYISFQEPFKKLVNQGMITGNSRFVYRVNGTNEFVSFGLKDKYETTPIHVDVALCEGLELDVDAFKAWRAEYQDATFVLEDGKYLCGSQVEKMSKRLFNTVNPDDVVQKYGADTFRLYEMFLGPLEQSKPWDTQGIEGVSRFLKKLWRLFIPQDTLDLSDGEPELAALQILHKTIRKVTEDTERMSFNTVVSQFMICVNELSALKCNNRQVLQDLLLIVGPFAPHIGAELWEISGGKGDFLAAKWPAWDEKYLFSAEISIPVAINGKTRVQLSFPAQTDAKTMESTALANEQVQKWLAGNTAKKVIVVPGRMINIVL